MKIGVRLVCGFAFVSLLSLVIGAISLYSTNRLEQDLTTIGNTYIEYAVNLGIIKAELNDIKTAQRTLLIADLPDDVKNRQEQNVSTALDKYTMAFKEIDSLSLDQADIEKLEQLKKTIQNWRESNDAFFKLAKENNLEKMKDIAFVSGRAAEFKVTSAVDAIVKRQRQMASEIVFEAIKNGKLLLRIMVIAISIGFIISIGLGFFLTWGITKPLTACMRFAADVSSGKLNETLSIKGKDETKVLSESLNHMVSNLREKIAEADAKSHSAEIEAENAKLATQQAEEARQQAERAKAEGMLDAANKLEGVVEVVTSASEELAAQIEQSSKGSAEQALRMNDTATAMEEMNATVLEVAKSASLAAQTADEAKTKAKEGSVIVSQVVKKIEDVRHHAHEMKADMSKLGEQAKGIGNIMNVISDIADQTNLLALNAAIEAARAGEAGRGFAVVADEVRKLAEKTMTATKEVGEAIRGIQDSTNKNINNVEYSGKTIDEATVEANKSGDALKEIVNLVDSASDKVRSIATASEQQSAASEEINHSIEDVSRISSETSNAMNHSAQAVNELVNQAQILQNLIEEMQTGDGEASAMKVQLT
jgi:methyl-accepting chemotaxis protein